MSAPDTIFIQWLRGAARVMLAALLCSSVASEALSATAVIPDNLKKVGFINGLQGEYDSQVIIALLREKGVLYEEMGPTWAPLKEFLRPLGALVVSGDPSGRRRPNGWPEALSGEDREALHTWIQDGGRVLFINSGLLMLKTGKKWQLLEWLGFTAVRVMKDIPLQDVLVSKPRDSLVAHFATQGKRPWMSGGYVTDGLSEGEALIDLTGKKNALLYVRTLGKGQVVHYGRQTFRFIKNPQDSTQKELNEEAIREQQGILRAVVAQWPTLTTTKDVLAAREAQLPGRRERLFPWYREPDHDPGRSDEPRLFHDPAPRAEELLDRFTLDVGRNEYESFFFYLTNFGPQCELSVTVSDLSGPSGHTMPASQLEVRVQSPVLTAEPKPAPQLRGKERTIWLYRPVQLPPIGREIFEVKELEQRVVWLTLSPRNGPAGVYRGTINIRTGDKTAFTIPLVVTVFEAPLRHDLVSLFNNINSVTLLPGAPIDVKTTDTKKYNAYLQLLRDYGCDLAEIIGPAYPRHQRPVIRGANLTITQAVRERPELFKGDTLPVLDFSWFTPSLKPVVAHGFRGLIARGGFESPFSVRELQTLYGDDSLTWNSPQGRRIFQWYLSEWMRYVRELGFDGQRLRYFDEIDEKGDAGLKEYLDFQSVAQAAGFKTGSTFQFYSSTNRDRIQQLNPATSCWMIQAPWSLGFYEATNGLKDIDSTDEILLYGWRFENYSYYRAHEELWRVFYPIAGAAHRIGLYYAGLIRPPGFATVVEDNQGFIVAVAMEASRDVLDVIKLYRALLFARDHLDTERQSTLDRELAKVVGTDVNALVRVGRGTTDQEYREYTSKNIPILMTSSDVTLLRYRQAKRKLLELSTAFFVTSDAADAPTQEMQ